MDDRTMLELAAKAAGIEWIPANTEKGIELEPVFGLWLKIHGEPYEGQRRRWNPLANDGDALRLMIAVGVGFIIDDEFVNVFRCGHELLVDLCEYYANHGGDKTAATRRAITRTAAEIQLAKESGK